MRSSSWWFRWRPWIASLPFLIVSILVGFYLLRSSQHREVADRTLDLLSHGEPDNNLTLLGERNGSSGSGGQQFPVKSAGSRKILSTPLAKSEFAVLAFLDGTVYFLDGNSGKIIGNFSLGSPLSSSYQVRTETSDDEDDDNVNNSDYFIYCGDDWKLYEHSREFGEKELEMSAEEYVGKTPIKHADGSATMGASKLTTFLFDAKTGKVINPVWPDSHTSGKIRVNEEKAIVPRIQDGGYFKSSSAAAGTFKIVKREYAITHYTKSRKLSWYMTVSYIEVYQCLGFDSFDCTLSKKVAVYPFRDNDPFSLGVGLPKIFQLPEPRIEGHLTQETADAVAPFGHTPLPALPSSQSHLPVITAERHASYSREKNVSASLKDEPFSGGRHTIHAILISAWYFVPFLSIIVFICVVLAKKIRFNKLTHLEKKQSTVNKKRKSRKMGNNKNSLLYEKDNPSTSRSDDAETERLNSQTSRKKEIGTERLTIAETNGRDPLFSHWKAEEYTGGRWVGKLYVSITEIAKGSNGTVVLEGIYDGRPVAVKRLVRAHHDVASKEIQILIASDRHSNIVRWYGVEYDSDFVYLSLERCSCSLYDLIQFYSDSPEADMLLETSIAGSESNLKFKPSLSEGFDRGLQLWKEDGHPSCHMKKVMRDIVSGLAHLHELGIIHRDMKPQNVLISFDRFPCAKISDMGISKHLPNDMSSVGHHTTGHGTSGWQAPEQLLRGRQTRAVDLFSLGCVLFFCLTKGRHPFGSYFERDTNILNNRLDLFLVDHIPEAVHLFTKLLQPDPDLRPRAAEVLDHPFFWDSETRLSFLRDASDRVELEDRESSSSLLKALESIGHVAFGGKWADKLDPPFIADMGRYRKYKFESTRDLLRVIRNKLNHFRELPKELQEILAPVPEGFDAYFSRRFPRLLIEVYNVVYRYCREDDMFRKYLKSSS